MSNVPSNWYVYDFPLVEIENAPVPSTANYDEKNCAWLIEFFGNIIDISSDQITLRYENNTPENREDDIFVSHPNDGEYLPALQDRLRQEGKSEELLYYESKAKESSILKLFEENSPANIKYFQT
jgi:hypothetical protein